MKKVNGKVVKAKLPVELVERMEVQAAKEGRTTADFIRRVIDRYLREVGFRGELSPEAEESIQKNKELLKLLRNG
jgi:predicted DNA-binding protein